MGRQSGFFDIDERLKELSAKGDDLERLNAIVDFEIFRPHLGIWREQYRGRMGRRVGGRRSTTC